MAAFTYQVLHEVMEPQPGDEAILSIAGSKPRITGPMAEQIIIARFHGRGYSEDRWGALVSGDGTRRIVLKARNVQEFHGGPGRWRKMGSKPKIALATSIVANARKRAGDTAGLEKMIAKKAAATKKKAAKKATKRAQDTALRAVAVALSAESSPAERRAILQSGGLTFENQVSPDSMLLQVQKANVTGQQVDDQLSVSSPPIPIVSRKSPFGRGTGWPQVHKWTDRTTGLPVEVNFKSLPDVELTIGNIPVSGVRRYMDIGRFIASVGGGNQSGIAGAIRGGKVPTLFMIVSTDKQKGLGTRMVRQFSKLIGAYGFKWFVAEGVGEEGAAFFERLEARGEIKVARKDGANWVIAVERAVEHPGQRLLFGPQRRSAAGKLVESIRAQLRYSYLSEGRDGEDWKRVLRAMKGALQPEKVSDLADDTDLSPRRLRALVIKYGAHPKTVRYLGGALEYWSGETTSLSQAAPGIRGFAAGMASREPAVVALVRRRM